MCFFPQVSALSKLYDSYPNATWILTTRPAQHWVDSVTNWPGLQKGLISCNLSEFGLAPGAGAEDSELLSFFEAHNDRVRKFAAEHPSLRLVEVDIENRNAAKVMQGVFGNWTMNFRTKTCWSRLNCESSCGLWDEVEAHRMLNAKGWSALRRAHTDDEADVPVSERALLPDRDGSSEAEPSTALHREFKSPMTHLAALLNGKYSEKLCGSPGRIDPETLRMVWLPLLEPGALAVLREVGLCRLRPSLPDRPFFTPWNRDSTPRDSLWVSPRVVPFATGVPHKTWIEVTHSPKGANGYWSSARNTTWLYAVPGSGVMINVGNTAVIPRDVVNQLGDENMFQLIDTLVDGPNALSEMMNWTTSFLSSLDSVQNLDGFGSGVRYNTEQHHQVVLLRSKLGETGALTWNSTDPEVRCGCQPRVHSFAMGKQAYDFHMCKADSSPLAMMARTAAPAQADDARAFVDEFLTDPTFRELAVDCGL